MRLVVVDWPEEDRIQKARQDAYAVVDVLETRAMEQRMVVVSASEIAESLTASGKVAIYGIYFDFGKADMQQESEPSLG